MRAGIIDANCLEKSLWSKRWASENVHFPEENSCPLYFAQKAVPLLRQWTHLWWSCFQNNCFALPFQCEIYSHAGDSQFFLYHPQLKKTSENIFPFNISLKTSSWASKIDNPLLIISVLNHFFPKFTYFRKTKNYGNLWLMDPLKSFNLLGHACF